MVINRHNFLFFGMFFCVITVWGTEALTCPYGWRLYQQHCFRFYKSLRTWTDARIYCMLNNAHLPAIVDKEMNDFLYANFVGYLNVWIGLNDIKIENQFEWADSNVSFEYKRWGSKQPNNYKEQDCANFWDEQRSYWADAGCMAQYSYICQKPALIGHARSCAGGWSAYGMSCFGFFKKELSWNDARDFCKSANGRLASISDEDTNLYLFEGLMESSRENVWIGLNDIGHEGQFRWADNDDNTYFRNWYPDQPDNYNNQDCAYFSEGVNSFWADGNCTEKHPFICERPDMTTTPSKSPDTQASPCPVDWLLYDESCYKLHLTNNSWDIARLLCLAENAHLATIADEPTTASLMSKFSSNIDNNVWIGLNDKIAEEKWQWADSDKRSKLVPPLSRDVNCAVIERTTKQWHIVECTHEFYFLCEQQVRNPVTTTTTGNIQISPSSFTPGKNSTKKLNSQETGLQSGAIAGIVISIIAVIAVIAIVVVFVTIRNRNNNGIMMRFGKNDNQS